MVRAMKVELKEEMSEFMDKINLCRNDYVYIRDLSKSTRDDMGQTHLTVESLRSKIEEMLKQFEIINTA
jgi:hypothetical protein